MRALNRIPPGILRFLILFAICGLVIFPAIYYGEFLQWDDDKNLYKNPWLLEGDVLRFWTEKFYFLLYIPVTYTVWTALWHLWSSAIAFHLLSLSLHAINSHFVYIIARRLYPELSARGLWMVTLTFALMPLQIEAFAWISGGRDLLALTFSLWAVHVFLNSSKKTALAASVLLFALGLLSKPTVAPLPVALLALTRFRQSLHRQRWVTLAIWLGLAVLDLAWNRYVQDYGLDANVASVPFMNRIIVTLDALGFYASKIAVPYQLNADYARTPWRLMSEKLYLSTLPALALATGGLIAIYRKFKISTLDFILFFLIGLSPVLGFIPFMAQAQSTVADRYVYWPWIAFSILIGIIVNRSQFAFKIMAAVLIIWAGVGFHRSLAWRTDDILFSDMLEKSPESFTANNALGAFAFQRGDYAEAEIKLKKAHSLMPHRAGVASNLVQLYWIMNKREAIRKEIEPLIYDGNWVKANSAEYIPLSVLFLVVGRLDKVEGRFASANENFCKAYALFPDNFSAKLEIMRSLEEIKTKSGRVTNCIHR